MKEKPAITFLEHLAELRNRIIRIVLVVVAASGICLAFTPQVLRLLLQPYGAELKVISPTEGISNYIRIGLTCGVILAMPYVLLELWRYVAPGLLARERRFAWVVIPSAFILFAAGAAFAWLLLIPTAIRFLAAFSLGIFRTEWTSENYIPFVTALLFWIGVSFEMPLAAFLLAKLRILSARLLLKAWRYAVILICIVAGIITPTVDPFNMLLVALPLTALYFLSILLAALARRGEDRRDTAAEPPADQEA